MFGIASHCRVNVALVAAISGRPLPEAVNFPAAGEDSLLQLMFKTQVATTTVDACDFSIPVTIFQ